MNSFSKALQEITRNGKGLKDELATGAAWIYIVRMGRAKTEYSGKMTTCKGV